MTQNRVAQTDRAVQLLTVVHVAGGVNFHAGIVYAPHSGGVKILQRQAHGIDHLVAGVAGLILAMAFHALAHRHFRFRHLVFFQGWNVGRRRGRNRTQQHFDHILAALYGRGTNRGRGQHKNAALAQQAEAVGLGQIYPAEPLSQNIGDSVMPGEPLIHERILRRHQVKNVVVFAHHAVEQ